ncbi:MAG: DUF4838 domain-containing protein, partial [Candidatus Hydrogenedentes bacterium]|nr:DUF4838 domain-containing protein [Candidatus Hydrogenedentota bacterium]
LQSTDGEVWSPVALLEEAGVDLRDPKLSITADDRLMIVAGGSVYREGKLVTRRPRVAFSADGLTWSATQPVLHDGEWLWRVTWHEGRAYGVTYEADHSQPTWPQVLYSSANGVDWEHVAALNAPGQTGETTLRFLDSGELMALVRRESDSKGGYIGVSKVPFTEWQWHETGYRLGGPNFIQSPDGHLWAGSRYYSDPARTVLATMARDAYVPVLLLPSAGDTSYPGMVWHEGRLWMSYYASHEHHTSIYLAQIALPEDGQSKAPRYTQVPPDQYMRTWLLCGPFPAGDPQAEAAEIRHLTQFNLDCLAAAGGEAAAAPKPGDTVAFEDQQRNWLMYSSDQDKIDLDLAISPKDPGVAYAYVEVESSAPQSCLLALSSNDGARVWLNGEQVHDVETGRRLQADMDMVPVVLKQGTNRLLLKIEERGDTWGFTCRLLSPENELLRERLSLFQIIPSKDAPPVLRLQHSAEMVRDFLQGVGLKVTRPSADAALWEGAWNGQPEMALPLDASIQGDAVLHVTMTMNNGSKIEQEYRFLAADPVPHELFAETKSEYQIVLDENASESEKWAASELQHWLKEAGGAELPITTAATEKCILVGYSPALEKLLGAAAPDEGDESFTYRSFGPMLAIWGGRQRGTMYGVFSFLERELGCRWYTPGVAAVPKRSSFAFTWLDHSEASLLPVRNDFYFEAFEPVWAARNRVNGAMGTREQPGGVEAYWGVHTFFPLMPPDEFFATHPEYYSLIDGKRMFERAQLCLTNPDVLNIITERLKKVMRENPNYLIYDVSQNDWRNPCQCDNCQAIAREQESESGPVLWFVNQVADRIKDEFPGKYVGTLAYQYTRKPPKSLHPRDNVVIRLCSIECCFSHDFKTCPQNQSFLADLRGWSAIAPRLYIWDYVVNFSHYTMPYPNFGVLASNLRTFAENNAIGVMEQAAYQSRGGEFSELRMYVLSRLLWNYNADVEAVIDDFMHGYYGRAGQYVRAYFDLLHGRVTPETHIHLGLLPADPLFSDDFVREAVALFEQAQAVADTEDVLHRVELASLPVLYLKCKRLPIDAKHDGTYEKFKRIVERENVTLYAEAGQPHKEAFHAEMDAVP